MSINIPPISRPLGRGVRSPPSLITKSFVTCCRRGELISAFLPVAAPLAGEERKNIGEDERGALRGVP
jgi:hypothetical protein